MSAWPAYARIVVDGYGLGQDPAVARTELEDGYVRQERTVDEALTTREITALLAGDADLVRFRAWAANSAHVPFAWRDPEDGQLRRARVRGGVGAIAYRRHRLPAP